MKREPDFTIDELKAVLERGLGFGIGSLQRLGGSSAFNFKAVRSSDGFRFLVKCSPFSQQRHFDQLVDHLNALRGTIVAQRIFENECPATFGGCNLLCLEWCPGESVFPDRLTDKQFLSFLDDYLAFSEAMQIVRCVDDQAPVRKWRDEVRVKCRGLGGAILSKCLDDIVNPDLASASLRMKVIHGDFHHGNFHFVDGRLNGIFDIEGMKRGYPTDDIVRYVTCAVEHLRWYELHRVRRMMRLFGLAVGHLPYAQDEWLAAIEGRFLRKAYMQTNRLSRVGLGTALNLAFRSRLYRKMKSIARERCNV